LNSIFDRLEKKQDTDQC